MHCSMTALRQRELDGLLGARATSVGAICERDRISEIQAHSTERRHELYTAGCIASREIDLCEREVVPSSLLRCEQPTPVEI